MAVTANSSDPIWKASNELRALGEALMRISRSLHEQTRKLEVAVEGTYAGESGDPRVRLLSDSLRVSRTADLELGRMNQTAQRILLSLQEQLDSASQSRPVSLSSPALDAIDRGRHAGDGVPTPLPTASKDSFERERRALNTSIINLQRERNELGTLYEIARVLNSTLEFDKVLRMVMDQVINVVKAERGFLMLINPITGRLEFTIARDKQQHTIDESTFQYQISHSTVERVVRTREPIITDDAQIDDALKEQLSIIDLNIRSIMCVPLMVRGNCIGAVYVDSRINTNLFGPNHRDLMLAFCHQAAIAIDNARLFADLTEAKRRVEEDKRYMDNIFASIANGVITTDSSGLVTKFNEAASFILDIPPLEAVGKHYKEVFSSLSQLHIVELLETAMVQHDHGTIVPSPVECEIPKRGLVNLTIYASALRNGQGEPIGMALVVDDRTELKRWEAKNREIRRIFGRFVHPAVVQRLIDDPATLKLGGEVREITIISADIRGFTRMNERMASKDVVNLLNSYLEIMVQEIWNEGGTITGFWGDELMAIFNAPLDQEDHALRAVRAAWKMRMAVLEHHLRQPQEDLITFGFGVNTGEAMVGNIGSSNYMQSYTAIGDAVNVASRLQHNADDNNILLNHSTFLRVRRNVQATRMAPLEVKNKTGPLDTWRLTGLC